MSESLLNGISGRIGEPEGAFRLLAQPEVQRELENYINQQIVNLSVSSGGEIIAARVNAAGTIISSSLVASVARQGEGWYRVTISTAAASSDDVKPTVTSATTAGNGGDGVTPLKAFSNFEVEDTDDLGANFYVNPADANELLLLGENTDGLWRHDITVGTFPGTATTVDAGTYAIQGSSQSGCVSYDGDYVVFSSKADTYGVRVVKLSDNTLYDLTLTPGPGVPVNDQIAVGAKVIGGSLRIWLREGSATNRYTPTLSGSPALGASDLAYTGSGMETYSNASPGIWDSDGYLWATNGQELIQLSPTTNSWWRHDVPQFIGNPDTSSPLGSTRMQFDTLNNRILVIADGGATGHYSGKKVLAEYRDWAPTGYDNSGTWRFLGLLGTNLCSFWYDAASGVFFVSDYGGGEVRRYVGDPIVLLDTVSVDDTSPDNADIDYDNSSPYTCYYDSDGYGYIQGIKGVNRYIVRIDYQGDPIGIGTGGAIVSSVLIPQYSVISSSVVDVYLYRTMSPPQRADGEFTIHIDTA